jgi:sporulation protein YlmC with PRC-barrel domain
MFDRERWDLASHMVGEPVVDKENHRIGRVYDIAEDQNEMDPAWLVVRTSRLLGRPRLIPIDAVREEGDGIYVPFSKRTVLLAPVPKILTNVGREERQALDFHYKWAA